MNLNGKKILFIGPRYFNYGIKIKEELERNGANVIWINSNIRDSNIYNSFVYKYIPAYSDKLRNRYYKKRLPNEYDADIVFVIKGETLSHKIMGKLKKENPRAYFIMYQWDSAKAEPNALELEKYFDKKLTFDYKDAQEYGWNYRPLFYLKESNTPWEKRSKDISTIGVIHSERIELLHKLKSLCDNNSLSLFHHLFCTFLGYYKRKYFMKDPVYVKARHKEITHKSLDLNETYAIYRDSKVVADYTFPGQTGFTMRTIECLGNHCKLITNNKYIKVADFYNENNILIYDINKFEIPKDFVNSPFIDIEHDIMHKYSLQGWIEEVFSSAEC